MSARWTFSDDLFLAKYFEAVGDMCGWHDLGKPKGAATKRVAKLKATGAWDALKGRLESEFLYTHAYLIALGKNVDVEMLEMTHPGCPDNNPNSQPESSPDNAANKAGTGPSPVPATPITRHEGIAS